MYSLGARFRAIRLDDTYSIEVYRAYWAGSSLRFNYFLRLVQCLSRSLSLLPTPHSFSPISYALAESSRRVRATDRGRGGEVRSGDLVPCTCMPVKQCACSHLSIYIESLFFFSKKKYV